MQVLLERLQKGRNFSLWMKYELSEHEEELITKYHVRNYLLVEGNPKEEQSRALKLAGALAVLAFLLVSGPGGIGAGLGAAFWTFVLGWIGIYYSIRERIKVRDILNGRHFACRSIVTLLNKENELGELAKTFAVFLEDLEHWGGRVVVEVAAGRAPITKFEERPPEVGRVSP
jgi:hypothetical protein